MRFLRNNRKVLNTKVFIETDFSVLNYEQLLKVNGAGGSSGGGSSGSSSSSSASSLGPSASSSSSASSSPSGSPSGGKGAGQSAPSSYGNDNSSAETRVYVENSNEGVANANPGDKIIRTDGTEVTLTQGDIDWAKEQINCNSSDNGFTGCNSNYCNNSPYTSMTDGEKVIEQINLKGQEKNAYKTGSYQCDEYAAEILEKAGINSADYYLDNASGKTVQQHIDEMLADNKGTKNNQSSLDSGIYVVFMDDGRNNCEEHAALLVVDKSAGSYYIYDNSSGNSNKGIEITTGTSAADVVSKFCYDTFYFQKIE